MAAPEVIAALSTHLKLDREKAVKLIETFLISAGADETVKVCHQLLSVLNENPEVPSWEPRHGALLGLAVVVPCLMKFSSIGKGDELLTSIKELALKYLSDAEVRVRLAAGDILGVLCKHCGPSVYIDCKEFILDMIKNNLERQIVENSAAAQAEHLEMEKLMEKFASTAENRRMSAEEIFHDTAGWKSLETSMKAFQAMVDGCGKDFLPFINQELLDLIFQSMNHTNRFVRETGFYVCSSLVSCGTHESEDMVDESNPLFEYGHQLSKYLGLGMSDNWSQVRLAASVATRKFLLAFPDLSSREAFFPELLSKMCLNRYYLADGVRLYSQETWKLISDNNGPALVEKYINDVIDFYIEQTQANNHAVREASCSCIAELAAKISREAVLPHVGRLLETLLVCSKDDSWPVRDAACLACGNMVVYFPDHCKAFLDELFEFFELNLVDNIPSVRQGAAAALANVAKAYGDYVFDRLEMILERDLQAVQNQPSESEKYANMEKSPATFGVVKRLRDNDMELHTDQEMYSCGSLAPKMGRGGVDDHLSRKFRRPAQPWERTDGSIYLMSDLSTVRSFSNKVAHLMPLLVKACSYRCYTHHVVLLETMCKQLLVIAKGIGKDLFKRHLESFLDPLFYALSCETALTSTAAEQCFTDLGQFLGPSILRGRIKEYNSSLLPQFDEIVSIPPPFFSK